MSLRDYEFLLKNLDGYFSVYEEHFEKYNYENYTEEVNKMFQQIKNPMSEVIEEIKFSIHSSHIYEENLNKTQILKGLQSIKRFEEIDDKHKEMKAFSQQLQLKNNIEEISKALEDVKRIRIEVEQTKEESSGIKNNLFSIFSFMVGLLGFIFINFNIFNDIGQFSTEKIVTTILLVNSSFVSGIIVLMTMFKEIIFGKESVKNKSRFFILKYLLVNFVIVTFVMLLPRIKILIYNTSGNNLTIPKVETELYLENFKINN